MSLSMNGQGCSPTLATAFLSTACGGIASDVELDDNSRNPNQPAAVPNSPEPPPIQLDPRTPGEATYPTVVRPLPEPVARSNPLVDRRPEPDPTPEPEPEPEPEPPPEICPTPVLSYSGETTFSGADDDFVTLSNTERFETAFSFSGWVRYESWTGYFNRVFDFGALDNQSMRLHRNFGSTLRLAFNSREISDFPGYWSVGEYIFVAVAVDSMGHLTVYKNGAYFDEDDRTPPSGISWSDSPNFYIARTNWTTLDREPNSHMSVRDLNWYEAVLSEECVAAQFATGM